MKIVGIYFGHWKAEDGVFALEFASIMVTAIIKDCNGMKAAGPQTVNIRLGTAISKTNRDASGLNLINNKAKDPTIAGPFA